MPADLEPIAYLDFPVRLECAITDAAGVECCVSAEWFAHCQMCGHVTLYCHEDRRDSERAFNQGRVAFVCPACTTISSPAHPRHYFTPIEGA